MKYRKLRIAWSVMWGLVAVLLCVLWVRSYDQSQSFELGRRVSCICSDGNTLIWKHALKPPPSTAWERAQPLSSSLTLVPLRKMWSGFNVEWKSPSAWAVQAPHWSLVVLITSFALIPWLHIHFSLRTLLMATALVAVGLGLIVDAMRS